VRDILQKDTLRRRGMDYEQGKIYFPQFITCCDWDIDKEEDLTEHYCPICDVNKAFYELFKALRADDSLSEEEKKSEEDKIKQTMRLANASFKYIWPIISREDPYFVEKDGDTEVKKKGWKVLTLPKTVQDQIQDLAEQYPKVFDADEGCDIVIERSEGGKTSYSTNFVIKGTSLDAHPLTDEEREYETLELKNFVNWHVSPRELFKAIRPEYREVITEVLGKTEDDYPEEHPLANNVVAAPKKKEKKASKKAVVKDEDADDSDESPWEDAEEEAPKEEAKASSDEVKPEDSPCFGTYDEDEEDCELCDVKDACKKKS